MNDATSTRSKANCVSVVLPYISPNTPDQYQRARRCLAMAVSNAVPSSTYKAAVGTKLRVVRDVIFSQTRIGQPKTVHPI